MKKLRLLAVAAIVATSATSALAQEPQGQRRGGGDPTAMLLQGITLSAEQQAKVDSLSRNMMAGMRTMRADSTVDRETRMIRGREMRSKHIESVKAILTDEQKQVFDRNVAEMRARMQQGGGQRPPQR